MRVASLAALTHGTVAILLALATGSVISPLGRPTGAGAWVEAIAGGIVAAIGAFYIVLALRGLTRRKTAPHGPEHEQGGSHTSRSMLAVAMGLLPCPLTIIVVGSAVARGATVAGIALAAGSASAQRSPSTASACWVSRSATPASPPPASVSGA